MAQLITLMYHRVEDPSNQLPTDNFVKHLEELVNRYTIVTPNQVLSKDKLNICLTFDDAYCDFYYVVYPLLKKHNIKAILAVPTAYIQDKTDLSYQQRLQVPYPSGMDAKTSSTKVPFCTWQELNEMQASGHVIIASHSHSHASLADSKTSLEQEVIYSKQLLESNLKTTIDYFIYPFGDFTRSRHQSVAKHYRLGFRIGSASNKSFKPSNKMIYRIDADPLWQQQQPLEPQLSKLKRKYWLNRIRLK